MVEKIINFIKSNHPDYDEIVSFFGIEKEEINAFLLHLEKEGLIDNDTNKTIMEWKIRNGGLGCS